MAVLEIEDALKRIVSRWVETASPIKNDLTPGTALLTVESTKRFRAGDEVMVEGPLDGEANLIIDEIVDDTTVRLATPIFNTWDADENIVLRKLTHGRYIEGIYNGNPEVISHYPAITINANTVTSEWFTLDSTKERYEIELTIYVDGRDYEDDLRYLLVMMDIIREGLKKNIFPLINDYDTTAVTGDIAAGDEIIRVADASVFNTELTVTSGGYPRLSDARVILEDRWKSEETRVQEIISPTTVAVRPVACQSYTVANNAIAIRPNRHIFNSWPHHADIGNVVKKSLMQAAVIKWFAEESVPVDFRNNDPHLK